MVGIFHLKGGSRCLVAWDLSSENLSRDMCHLVRRMTLIIEKTDPNLKQARGILRIKLGQNETFPDVMTSIVLLLSTN